MQDFRCKRCQKLLGKYRECNVLEIKCPRCGLKNILKEENLDMKLANTSHLLKRAVK